MRHLPIIAGLCAAAVQLAAAQPRERPELPPPPPPALVEVRQEVLRVEVQRAVPVPIRPGPPARAVAAAPALRPPDAEQDARLRAQCMTNLKQLGLGCHVYAMDYNDRFPSKLQELSPNYIGAQQIFFCPATERAGGGLYILWPGLSESTDSSAILMFEARGNHPGGRNVLFVDGHVEWLQEENFQETFQKWAAKYPIPGQPRQERTAVATTQQQILLANKDRISGMVKKIDQRGALVIHSPFFIDDAAVPLKHVKEIRYTAGSRRLEADSDLEIGRDLVQLSNGDIASGTVTAMDADTIQLETRYAGTVTVRRAMVRAVHFGGAPPLLDETFDGGAGKWQPHGSGWSAVDGEYVMGETGTRHASIPLEQKGATVYEWTMRVLDNTYIRGGIGFFCSDSANRWGGNGYHIYVNNTEVHCYRVQSNSANQIGRATISPTQKTMTCKVAYDPEAGTIQFWANGKKYGTWTDSRGAPWKSGKHVILHSRRTMAFDNIVVRPGAGLPSGGTGSKEEGDRLFFANGDTLAGTVSALKDGAVTITGYYGTLTVPVERLGTALFESKSRELQRRRADDVRLTLLNGNRITLELKGLDAGQISGRSDSLGDMRVDQKALKSVTFWLYE